MQEENGLITDINAPLPINLHGDGVENPRIDLYKNLHTHKQKPSIIINYKCFGGIFAFLDHKNNLPASNSMSD